MVSILKATQQKSNFSESFSKNNIYSDTLMKNCGISKNVFGEINKYINMREKNHAKKVSTNVDEIATQKINEFQNNENEDKETYEKDIEDNSQKKNMKTNNNNIINNINIKDNENEYYDPQIHFEYLLNNFNDGTSETSQGVKAYKSKHKSKYIKIYETNSINFNEKNKYKLFHKCCYPGCNRTFSSSGWLKAHFKNHLKQIHNSLFSKLFNKFILSNQVLLMNHLNNNFLGLEKSEFNTKNDFN